MKKETSVVVNVRIPRELLERMEKTVAKEYVSRSSLILRAIAQYLDAKDAMDVIREFNGTVTEMLKNCDNEKITDTERKQVEQLGTLVDMFEGKV